MWNMEYLIPEKHANKQVSQDQKQLTHPNKWQEMALFLSIHLNPIQSPLWSPAQVFSPPKTTERNPVHRNLLALTIYVFLRHQFMVTKANYYCFIHAFSPESLGKKSVLVLLSPSALLSSLGIQGREFKRFSDPRYNIVWEKPISLNDTTVTYITHVNNS